MNGSAGGPTGCVTPNGAAVDCADVAVLLLLSGAAACSACTWLTVASMPKTPNMNFLYLKSLYCISRLSTELTKFEHIFCRYIVGPEKFTFTECGPKWGQLKVG